MTQATIIQTASTAKSTNAVIRTENLTKVYRDGKSSVKALDGLTMNVPEGSIFGFLGPNGSGKSTTIRMLVGLAPATSGRAQVAGADIHDDPNAVRSQVGYLAQSPLFYNYMTGRETLEYVAGFYPWVTDPVDARISELLEMVGLGDAGDRKVGGYSGGMKQRLGIAQSLVGRPRVVILDEPVSALDPIGRYDVMEIMKKLRGHTTVMFSTHILDDVQRLADHVAILDQGRLVAQGETEELLNTFTKSEIDLVVEVQPSDVPALHADLVALPGVTSAEINASDATPGTARFVIGTEAENMEATRRRVQDLVVRRGLLLRRGEPMKLDLESVFLKLVS
jgi:ABC-2 type transport system ATP-binding protein